MNWPADGLTIPLTQLTIVVFPALLAPSSATISPLDTEMETFRRTSSSPYPA